MQTISTHQTSSLTSLKRSYAIANGLSTSHACPVPSSIHSQHCRHYLPFPQRPFFPLLSLACACPWPSPRLLRLNGGTNNSVVRMVEFPIEKRPDTRSRMHHIDRYLSVSTTFTLRSVCISVDVHYNVGTCLFRIPLRFTSAHCRGLAHCALELYQTQEICERCFTCYCARIQRSRYARYYAIRYCTLSRYDRCDPVPNLLERPIPTH